MSHEKNTKCAAAHARRRRASHSRGVALITTLILLALLGAASMAVALLVSSDTFINGYYRNYRGSFYAADSGANAVVESMKNAINAAGDDTTVPPLPANGSVPAAVTAAYTPFEANYYSVGDPGSWNGQFEAAGTTTLGTAQKLAGATNYCVQNPVDAVHPNNNVTCDYIYPFTVVVNGRSSGSEQEQVVENGSIRYHSFSGQNAGSALPSFAKWGAFITNFGDCQGPLVPGTMTGPFFTDGQWNFGNYTNPGYTFTDPLGQAGSKASWWKNNNCTDSTSAPSGFTNPNFQGGFNLNQAYVQAPSDTYNQAQAVLDGKGIPPCTAAPCPADPPPSQAQMATELQTVKGVSYPASGSVPNGVYIPEYSVTTGGTTTNMYGSNPASGGDGYAGGFYIQGNASISLTASTDSSGNPTQKYTITQGATTTTITVDTTTNQTIVKSGSTTQTLTGVPAQLDPNSGAVMTQQDPSGSTVSPTMLYVNGQISGLSGTVQNNTGVTISASSDISITGNVTYASSPVSIPSDTLNSSSNAGVLGIYTNGNINLYPGSGGDLTVNASLAALSGVTGGTSGFNTPGGSIGTWTIVGGRAEDQAHSVNISTGNTYYDRRFASGSFGPPWFPTAVPQPGTTTVPPTESMSISRTSWQEVSR
jgi:hypothetical protein